MSLIPIFKIGVWNVWLLMLPLVLVPIVASSAKKGLFKKPEPTKKPSRNEKLAFVFSKLILLLIFLYSVFLPFRLGTLWFAIGLTVGSLGLAMYIVVSANIASTPVDRPVTKGLYRFYRHPMYFSGIFIFVGAGIASASWLFLVLSILSTLAFHANAIFEERICREAYGDIYNDYLARTPRWIGFPRKDNLVL